MPTASELNFDALVGLTHNYAGLAPGNIASATHAGARSSPKSAAKEGLAKMRLVARLGLVQGVLPPQERPDTHTLRRLGFSGTDEQVLRRAAADAPALLSACCSASSMWCANAATVSPSADTADARVHFTPANLNTHFHRHIEAPTTTRVLRAVFADPARFQVHDPLPDTPAFSDEGAANFMRFCSDHASPGLEVIVYGRKGIEKAAKDAPATTPAGPTRFPARQTLESAEAIFRRHAIGTAFGAPAGASLLIRQNPNAIDQGVFHNDVIAVANRHVLFSHEHAFAPGEEDRLLAACRQTLGTAFAHVRVPAPRVTIVDAVKTYLFNSQLLSIPGEDLMVLIAPAECREHPGVSGYLSELTASKGPIGRVIFVDVRQSMNNGGGPACLRLRVALTDQERAAMNQRVLLTDSLAARLDQWIDRHYRDELLVSDLVDPKLITECRTALDELTSILGLGSVYEFQR